MSASHTPQDIAGVPAWRGTSLAKRPRILSVSRELLEARAGELAAIVTSEHGKVFSAGRGRGRAGLVTLSLVGLLARSHRLRDVS